MRVRSAAVVRRARGAGAVPAVGPNRPPGRVQVRTGAISVGWRRSGRPGLVGSILPLIIDGPMGGRWPIGRLQVRVDRSRAARLRGLLRLLLLLLVLLPPTSRRQVSRRSSLDGSSGRICPSVLIPTRSSSLRRGLSPRSGKGLLKSHKQPLLLPRDSRSRNYRHGLNLTSSELRAAFPRPTTLCPSRTFIEYRPRLIADRSPGCTKPTIATPPLSMPSR